MSRQLDNLRRVFEKLQARYGDGELVSPLKSELASRERAQSAERAWPDSSISDANGEFKKRHAGRLGMKLVERDALPDHLDAQGPT
jgi:hypothetical protein